MKLTVETTRAMDVEIAKIKRMTGLEPHEQLQKAFTLLRIYVDAVKFGETMGKQTANGFVEIHAPFNVVKK